MATYDEEGRDAQRILRLTDIADEPLELLMPISGYENLPIVSLEKAIEPLVSILPKVRSYAYVAKRLCTESVDNLTSDELASIKLYSMGWHPKHECLYHALNAALRSKDRSNLTPWFLFLRLFLGALFHIPPVPKMTVFRGIKLDLSQQYRRNQSIVWWGFSSCSCH